MKQVDYIIVGLGIAGICLAERLREAGKTFVVIDNGRNTSTVVSGGVLNPTVLKRFTAAWNAKAFTEVATSFYQELSTKFEQAFFSEIAIYRILNSIEEQNNWMIASDKQQLKAYLSPKIIPNENPNVVAPYGLGGVCGAGRIFPSKLLKAYRVYLDNANLLISEEIDYDALEVSDALVKYNGVIAKKVIFAEGAGVLQNPYFPKDYLVPNKGEYIIVSAPELKSEAILKGPMMLIPLGGDLYKVGASYGRGETSTDITPENKEKISEKLSQMISCSFKIVDQVAGVRPTVKDRKPLLGSLHDNDTVVFFNGLGTRGILMAPKLSELLCDFLEKGSPLPEEIRITRFG